MNFLLLVCRILEMKIVISSYWLDGFLSYIFNFQDLPIKIINE